MLLAQTRAQLDLALARITELEARLAANSGNSHRPPSSDGLAKPAPRSLRGKTGRKPGGQPGHRGETLQQVANPDDERVYEPGPCHRCGRCLSGRPVTGVERRQVFDLPPVAVEVTEHQLVERECVCGHRTRATAPHGVGRPGPVRSPHRRDSRLFVRWPVPVQGTYRASVGAIVRHPDLGCDGRGVALPCPIGFEGVGPSNALEFGVPPFRKSAKSAL